MKLGKYHALKNAYLRSDFLSYIENIDIPIIDYFALGVQDTINKTSTSIMSRQEWQKTFQNLELAIHDPVRKASFNTRSCIFSFDELDYENSSGKYVMKQRKKNYIENGLVFMRRGLGYNYMLTLATGYKNFNSYKFLIEKNIIINKIFDDLISLTTPFTNNMYNEIINHQKGGDAK